MIILSLPYYDAHSLISEPDPYVDWVEYRLDYCQDLAKIDFSAFPEKSILTIRAANEGGYGEIDDDTKLAAIDSILSQTTCLLDLEYTFLLTHPELCIAPSRLILSLHTDSTQTELISDFIHTTYPAAHYKLAVGCESILTLEAIRARVTPRKSPFFSLIPLSPCAGSLRLYYRLLPSEFMYVYLHEPMVKNQISLQLATLCRIKSLSQDTRVYGIIGGEQVLQSLSVKTYNAWFTEARQNSVFLPIVSTSLSDALDQVHWLSSHADVRGFAITMPFKQQFAAYLKSPEVTVNTWLPDSNISANTDTTAMNRALDIIGRQANSTVLILGKGAMAALASELCTQRDYRVFHMHRDGSSFVPAADLARHDNLSLPDRFDILINATPWGNDSSDDPQSLPAFSSLIDLPYSTEPTTLVKCAQQQRLPYIDGIRFWIWQSEEQCKILGIMR